ncbi:hypothetical protein H0H92_002831 [Tricholoma furcatifolium]|nr:hypothetical protein H0H92_002831 [Tricholoma furcatifolium]
MIKFFENQSYIGWLERGRIIDSELRLKVDYLLSQQANMNQSQIPASVLKDAIFFQAIKILHTLSGKPWETNDAMKDVQDTVQRFVKEKIVDFVHTLEKRQTVNVAQSRRLWINAILFRVSAMVQGRMVLSVEQDVPSLMVSISGEQTYKIDGTVDYAALTGASPRQHEYFLRLGTEFGDLQCQRERFNGLFVTQISYKEDNYIPRVLTAMYTSAKSLKTSLARKKVIRGAMTDGYTWMFVILYLREDGDGDGGSFWRSSIYEIETSGTHVRGHGPDIITGILAYWVCYSTLC